MPRSTARRRWWMPVPTRSSPRRCATSSEFAAMRAALDVPILANMTEFGKSDLFSTDQLRDVGVNIVIWPVSLLRIAMGAAGRALDTLNDEGHLTSKLGEMQHRADLYDLIDYEDYNHFDQDVFNFQIQRCHADRSCPNRVRTERHEHDQGETDRSRSRRASPGSSSTTPRSARSTPRRTRLLYRGYPVQELAATQPFEAVAYLLWHGELPTDVAARRSCARSSARTGALPADVRAAIDLVPLDAHPMDEVRTAVSLIGARDLAGTGSVLDVSGSAEENLARSIRLFAVLPAIVAYGQRRRRGQQPVAPRDDLDYSAQLPVDDVRRGARPGRRRRVQPLDDPVRRALLQRLDVHRRASSPRRSATSTPRSSARSARSRARCTAAPTRPCCTSSTRSAPPRTSGRGSTRRSPRSARSWASATASTSAATRACRR